VREDLKLARERLEQKNLTLVVVKRSKVILETSAHGIRGLLEAIERLKGKMRGSSVADKVVGRAAALLCVYSGVAAVFATIASHEGIEVLLENHVSLEFDHSVPHIMDSKGTGVCPFEKLASTFSSPKEAYKGLRAACG